MWSLEGCTTWAARGFHVQSGEKIQLIVMPIECTAPITHLKSIETIPEGADPPDDEGKVIRDLLDQATREMTESLDLELDKTPYFHVISHQTAKRKDDQPGGQDQADAVLKVQLSGYGKLKRRWQLYMVGSGLVEGLLQGIAGYKISSNIYVGIGLAAEEIAQELLTWVGGVALFNKHFTPVLLEARLYDAHSGKKLWTRIIAAVGKKKDFSSLSKEESHLLEVRLRVVREKAISELTQALVKKTRKQLAFIQLSGQSASPGNVKLAPIVP